MCRFIRQSYWFERLALRVHKGIIPGQKLSVLGAIMGLRFLCTVNSSACGIVGLLLKVELAFTSFLLVLRSSGRLSEASSSV